MSVFQRSKKRIPDSPCGKTGADSSNNRSKFAKFFLDFIHSVADIVLEHIVAGQVYIAQDVASGCAATRAGASLRWVNDVKFIKTHRVVLQGLCGFLCGISRVIHCVTDAANAISALGEISKHDLHTHQLCHPFNELSNELHGGNQWGENGFQGRVEQRADRLCQHIKLCFQNLDLVGGALNGLRKVALHIGSLLHNGDITQNRLICLRQARNLLVKAQGKKFLL